uniref:Protein O-mannosyl-transferase 2 n=1 Tax=Plectus sambesii TaxID=2011161 RepID=A0A914UWU0_9BILA
MESESHEWRRAQGRLRRSSRNGRGRPRNDYSKSNECVNDNLLTTLPGRYHAACDSVADTLSTKPNGTTFRNDGRDNNRNCVNCNASAARRCRDVEFGESTAWLEIATDILIALALSALCALKLKTVPTAAAGITWQEKPLIYDANNYNEEQFFVPRHQPPGLPLLLHYLCATKEQSDMLDMSRVIARFLVCALLPAFYALSRLLGFGRISSLVINAVLLADDAFILTANFELVNLSTSLLLIACILCSYLQSSRSFLTFSWLIFTTLFGLAVALAVCISYRSLLFIVPLIFGCLYRGSTLFSDNRCTIAKISCKIATEFLTLLVLPATIYLAMFQVHLKIASRSSIQSAQMTSSFQMSLSDGLSSFSANQSVFMAFDSQATIRSFGKACWLNSNNMRYPLHYPDGRVSSQEQVVGCYSFKDANNWWIIESDAFEKTFDRHVSYGDVIKVRHRSTGHLLNSHDVSAALTPEAQEITCYVNNTDSTPPQTSWKLINPTDSYSTAPIRAVRDPFQLVHVNTKAHLRLSRKRLPDWGGGKLELVADCWTRNDLSDWFNFEENMILSNTAPEVGAHEMIAANIEQLGPSFFEKIVEIHRSVRNSAERSTGFLESAHGIDFWQWATYRNLSVGYYWKENKTFNSIVMRSNDITRFCLHISSAAFGLAYIIGSVMRQRRMSFDAEKWNLISKVAEQVMLLFVTQLIAIFVDSGGERYRSTEGDTRPMSASEKDNFKEMYFRLRQ